MSRSASPDATVKDRDDTLHVHTQGWKTTRHSCQLSIGNESYTLQDLLQDHPFVEPLEIHHLKLHINTGNDSRSVIDTQDILFAILRPFYQPHNLHSLEVHISIGTGNDIGWEIFSSNYAQRMYALDMAREFRTIKPGDISRAHIAAFLTDPLRSIRNVKNGKKQGKVTIKFAGDSGKPWQEIPRRIRDMARSKEAGVKDYEIFRNYFEVLRPLLQAAAKLEMTVLGGREHAVLQKYHSKLAAARIQGNFADLLQFHNSLIMFLGSILREASSTKLWPSRQTAFTVEELVREITYGAEALKDGLPERANVSFYGYNEADARFAEYKRDREGFVIYGSKPKRIEENGEPKRKKAKTS